MKVYSDLEIAAMQLADYDPCFYDHHGYCQTHFLHSKPCPMEVINRFAERETGEEDE